MANRTRNARSGANTSTKSEHNPSRNAIAAGACMSIVGIFIYTTMVSLLFIGQATYSYASQQGGALIAVNTGSNVAPAIAHYTFSALIGSVLNGGVNAGVPSATKSLQTASSGYAYIDQGTGTYSTTSATQSPYADIGYIPTGSTPSASTNGGGISFSGFVKGTNTGDNIMRIGNSQLSSLVSNYGKNNETEYLWVTGFPVFNQTASNPHLQTSSVGGAYQIVFNNPINWTTVSTSINFRMFSRAWRVIGANAPSSSSVTPGHATSGGSIAVSSPAGSFYTITSGQRTPFNNGWYAELEWTTPTGSNTAAPATALYSIIFYSSYSSVVNLAKGQTFNFIAAPGANLTHHNFTYQSDTLNANVADFFGAGTSKLSSVSYQNIGINANGNSVNASIITEPAQLLHIQSSIPRAFSYAGTNSNNVTYDLTPYQLNELGVVSPALRGNVVQYNVSLAYGGANAANWINSANPLSVSIAGMYKGSPITHTVSFTSPTQTITFNAVHFDNISSIQISSPLPGSLLIQAYAIINSASRPLLLANLSNPTSSSGAAILYGPPTSSYYELTTSTAVSYNQQNGGKTNAFSLLSNVTPSQNKYFVYEMNEQPVPSSSATDQLQFGLFYAPNAFQFTVGSTSGVPGNITYASTQYTSGMPGSIAVLAGTGFRTERGSRVVGTNSTAVIVNLATAIDTLNYQVT